MSQLPNGWREIPLEQGVEIIRGVTFSKSDRRDEAADGYIPCLRTSNIQEEIETDDLAYIPSSLVKRSDRLVQSGDIIISMSNSAELVGKVAKAKANLSGFAFGAFLSALRSTTFDRDFLFYLFRSPSIQAQLRATASQTVNIANLSLSGMAKIALPLPPLDEQRRIVAKLDALFARSRRARAELERVPDLVERAKQAVLAKAFSGELTREWRARNTVEVSGKALRDQARLKHRGLKSGNKIPQPIAETEVPAIPESWAWCSAAEIVEPGAEIVYGIVQPGPKLDDGVPYVRGMDIENGQILVGQLLKTSPEIAERYARASLAGGDVLLGIIRATKVAIVPDQLTGANITQGTARFRPSSVIQTKYLARILEAPDTQNWLHSHYRGIDMPGLNLADVRQAPIPLPPLEEQTEIVRRIEAAFVRIDRMAAEASRATALLDRLEQATLAKAFRGELVGAEDAGEVEAALAEMREEVPIQLGLKFE